MLSCVSRTGTSTVAGAASKWSSLRDCGEELVSCRSDFNRQASRSSRLVITSEMLWAFATASTTSRRSNNGPLRYHVRRIARDTMVMIHDCTCGWLHFSQRLRPWASAELSWVNVWRQVRTVQDEMWGEYGVSFSSKSSRIFNEKSYNNNGKPWKS